MGDWGPWCASQKSAPNIPGSTNPILHRVQNARPAFEPPPHPPPPPPPRPAEIKGWKVTGYAPTATWRGPADASRRKPRGHGILVWDDDGAVWEGRMDDQGRRQGQWVAKAGDGSSFWSIQCADDAAQNAEAIYIYIWQRGGGWG
jgi:hypothetical protein